MENQVGTRMIFKTSDMNANPGAVCFFDTVVIDKKCGSACGSLSKVVPERSVDKCDHASPALSHLISYYE